MTIGLVLSGGGVRGMAHIGAIKALEEHGISPTHIAGTSAGAVVGALYAYGYDWSNMLAFFEKIQILNITKYALNKPGFIDAEKFYSDFKTFLKNDSFSNLKKPLFITATNILDGTLKIFNEGELIKPLLASAAFPGLFAPVKINNSYYVDGGALNNFPVELLKGKCDKIIGVYTNGISLVDIKELKHAYNVLERAFKLKSVKEDFVKFNDCDLMIYPKTVSSYGTFDRKYIHDIFKLGYDATIAALNKNFEIKSILKNKPHETKLANVAQSISH